MASITHRHIDCIPQSRNKQHANTQRENSDCKYRSATSLTGGHDGVRLEEGMGLTAWIRRRLVLSLPQSPPRPHDRPVSPRQGVRVVPGGPFPCGRGTIVRRWSWRHNKPVLGCTAFDGGYGCRRAWTIQGERLPVDVRRQGWLSRLPRRGSGYGELSEAGRSVPLLSPFPNPMEPRHVHAGRRRPTGKAIGTQLPTAGKAARPR